MREERARKRKVKKTEIKKTHLVDERVVDGDADDRVRSGLPEGLCPLDEAREVGLGAACGERERGGERSFFR